MKIRSRGCGVYRNALSTTATLVPLRRCPFFFGIVASLYGADVSRTVRNEDRSKAGCAVSSVVHYLPWYTSSLVARTRLRRYPPKMRLIGVVSASLFGAEGLTPLRLR